MIEIVINVADLTKVRFGRSAVAEIQASLHGLRHPYKHAIHNRLTRHLPRTAGPELQFLMDVFAPTDWVPDTLMPEPVPDGACSAAKQIESVAGADLTVVERDLEHLQRVDPERWGAVDSFDFRACIAQAVAWYWDQVMCPLWERVESIATADLAYRATQIAREGIGNAVRDLSPYCELKLNTIQISGHAHDGSYEMGGQGVWLVPTVFRWPRLSVTVVRDVPILSYGARGAGRVWEELPSRWHGVDELLGRTRASILRSLTVPRTTKALADSLSLSPGNVSQHLAVMEASGLLVSHRDGKLVLYERTDVGELVLGAQGGVVRRRRGRTT